MDMVKSLTDLRQEKMSKKLEYVKEKAYFVNYNTDSLFGVGNVTQFTLVTILIIWGLDTILFLTKTL
jgi:hypothetical protein